jgi:hypothetical protein
MQTNIAGTETTAISACALYGTTTVSDNTATGAFALTLRSQGRSHPSLCCCCRSHCSGAPRCWWRLPSPMDASTRRLAMLRKELAELRSCNRGRKSRLAYAYRPRAQLLARASRVDTAPHDLA